MDRPVIVIAGPTCTGKSQTAVCVAGKLGGEIVSADSMQVYRGMDIGTAKITTEERRGIPHHMIDIADPHDGMNVNLFTERALECIADIRDRGKAPVLVGGTGFYIESILFDPAEGDAGIDPEYRRRLRKRAADGELAHLYAELCAKDPEYASTVHQNNVIRVVRALEYMHVTGRPYSEYALHTPSRSRFPFRCFVLDDDRRALYGRIDARVDAMVAGGLAEEVLRLLDSGVDEDSVAMQGIGYRQMCSYLSGDLSLQDAVRDIKNATRHFAKRQLTWFRHRDYAEWMDISGYGRDPRLVSESIVGLLERRTHRPTSSDPAESLRS